MAKASSSTRKNYLFLLMNIDVAPLDADGDVFPEETVESLQNDSSTASIATMEGTGISPKEAFTTAFNQTMEDEGSNLFEFVGEYEDPIFVWVFSVESKDWAYMGPITKNVETSYEVNM